jgi:hypothetical protein
MEQKIDTNHGPITQTGNIVICNGAAICPLSAMNLPESKLQAEFFERTGIWAPPGAREKLEMLMSKHNFTAPRLRAAWKENNLCWDVDKNEFIARTYWIELVYGNLLIFVLAIYFIVQGISVVIPSGRESKEILMALVTIFSVYGGLLWMTVRFVITPYQVAKRVKLVLKKDADSKALCRNQIARGVSD